MAPPPVPSNILQYIEQAAKATGLPQAVVAAQNYTESAYGTNEGPSSAGALGPWQFEPSTYTGLGYNTSTIDSWSQSTQAYIKLMNENLKQYNGNVRDALAAYNAGSGDISAGYGYADSILAMAGNSTSLTVAPASTSSSGSSSGGTGGGGILGDIWAGTGIPSFFSDADTFVNKVMWLLEPSSWLRIGAFLVGVALLLFALHGFYATATGGDLIPHSPPAMPIPVPV